MRPYTPGFGLCVCTIAGRSSAEHRHELGQRLRRPRASAIERVAWLQRDVADAARLERLDVRTRRRHADHLVARGRERLELRTEQQLEADVGGGHVHDERPGAASRGRLRVAHAVQRRGATCLRAPCRPASLRSKYCMPSLTWIGERARRYGSAARTVAVAVRIHARAGERGRAEPIAHQARRVRASRRPPSGRRSRPRRARGARRSARSTGRARRRRRRPACGRAGGACACATRRRRARSRTRRAGPPTRSGAAVGN